MRALNRIAGAAVLAMASVPAWAHDTGAAHDEPPGWTLDPWILLPLLAAPAQRFITTWVVGRYALLTRAAGVLLVAIGAFGFWTEVLPTL